MMVQVISPTPTVNCSYHFYSGLALGDSRNETQPLATFSGSNEFTPILLSSGTFTIEVPAGCAPKIKLSRKPTASGQNLVESIDCNGLVLALGPGYQQQVVTLANAHASSYVWNCAPNADVIFEFVDIKNGKLTAEFLDENGKVLEKDSYSKDGSESGNSRVVKNVTRITLGYSDDDWEDSGAQPLGNDAQDAVLNFVWKYWDFIVDKVCYDCADVLIRLIELHLSTCGACSAVEKCKWVRGMFNELFSSPVSCKARYKAIVALYALLPNEVAQRFNQPFMDVLYAKMGSFTLSVVLSELICADLEARRDERNWDYHVKSMINLLSAGPGHCSPLDRLLPRIMKNPLLRIGFVDKLMDAVKDQISTASTSATADFLVGRMALAKFVVFTRTTCQWRDFVVREEMARALLHVNVQVRLTALSLLCEHPKRTLFIELEDCELALAYIESNMTEQEPSNRQKILASLKKFLMRLCDVADQISKKPGETGPIVGYSDFLRRLAALTIESIKPGANFSRRIMALSILDLLYKDEVLNLDGKETLRSHAHLEDLLTEDLRALLIGCFDDSFQICQKEALRLLQTLKFPENFDFDSFIAVTESQLDSLRSHDSLSLSYRLRYYAAKRPNDVAGLLERLIKKVLASCEALDKESLIAISYRLLHPTLSSIALLLEPKPAIAPEIWSTQILPMCFRAANLVNNTTGECLAPQVSQTLVACCWRAHKQISTILSLAAGQLEVRPPADVRAVFDFYWLELTECRHCGAFESAVDGFQVLCRRLWAVQNPHLPNLLAALSGILEAIDGKNDLDKLCSTRRSAGLPYLVAALCSTDPGCSALDLAMGKLMGFEGRESTSRIHSLNVLRSLFMHSELGERVLKYAEKAVKLGVEGCSAPNWSERNASAQLVASLRTRLFGVARAAKVELHVDERNTRSAFEFFSRYPSLYPFLFDHLSKHTFHDEFGLFPVLVLLSHLNPSTNASNPFPLHPFVPKIMKLLLTLRSEKLRKLAVAALVAISTREDLLYCLEIFSGLDIARLPHNVLDSLFNLDPRMYFLFKAQNRGILAKAVENGAYLDYNDYVLNQFFQLCLMTGMHDPMRKFIENKELLDKLTLALRPLARFAVAQQFPPKILKEHPAFRREVYREILKKNCVTSADWTLFLCSG
ncbi:unnamed protein product, partial [Mesorhabditis spiculigera]